MKDSGNKKSVDSIETEYIKMYIKDGIFQCVFKEIDEMNIDIAKINIRDRMEFIKGKAYPCFFDITQIKQSTKEARDYLANEGNELVTASAILVNSPVMKMMANFYIMVNKPKNPTRMFTDKKSALQWLQQFKGNS